MDNRTDQFAQIALQDAMDGIHKAVGARLAVMGLFFTLISGSLVLAATQQALVFLIATVIFTVIFLLIELPQRMALCSYYFKYIDVSSEFYGRKDDYVWLAGFTPLDLLQRLSLVASGEHQNNHEKARKLAQALSPFRTPTFSAITAVLICAEFLMLYWAWSHLGWSMLPVVRAPSVEA